MSDLLGRDPDDLAAALATHRDYRVIRRYRKPVAYSQESAPSDQLKIGIFVDVETTGLDHQTDAIIELAMVKFEFSSDGMLYKLGAEYDQLNDPGKPIPQEVTHITGISDDMVAGQHIKQTDVEDFIAEAAIIIAHNAAFDRKFVEASFACFEKKAWACSATQIPWRMAGFESSKLEYLAYRQGFFFDGHRAVADCLAGIHIMSFKLPDSDHLVFRVLLEEARKKSIRLWASNSPFESKDVLKARGYRWNNGQDGHPKAWYIDLRETELDQEIDFLHQKIFGQEVFDDEGPSNEHFFPQMTINAFNRFSARI